MTALPLDGVPLDRRPPETRQWPERSVWAGMLARCYNPNATSFARYGGRGIAVCDRWRGSFENFIADMGPRPTAYHQIDRINNDGNYEPTNCRWVTRTVQATNKSRGTVQRSRTLIGDVVRAVRVHRQVTQEDMMRPGGRSRVELAQIESGKNQMRSAVMREAVALGLGVDVTVIGAIVSGNSSPEAAARAFNVPVALMCEAWAAVPRAARVTRRIGRILPHDRQVLASSDALWEAACAATIGGC